MKRHLINTQIKSSNIRIIGDENFKLGVISFREALTEAENRGLDLIEVSRTADGISICKIADLNKVLYEQKQRDKQNKQKQKKVETKELRFSPNISQHDLETKAKHAREFLTKGNKVKIVCLFDGREFYTNKEKGELVLLKMAESVVDIATLEKLPKLEGKRLVTFLIPK